jgi:aspartate/methionine/tyrosine aminotransferase
VRVQPFRMERWQSTWEHRVPYNLSESGVEPLTVAELLELCGAGGTAADALDGVRLGYGQTNGSDALRARIAALYPGAGDANVAVTAGGAEANFACVWRLTEAGAAAAVMLPNYMQVPGLLAGFGVRALPFHLRAESGWAPDLDALAAALRDGARAVVVTNPNNPTGRALTGPEMDEIARLADRHGAWILSDEVYQGAERAGTETPSFWGRAERVLVTNSLSKAYGLPGLRLGWVVGPAEAVEDLWGRTDYTTIAPSTLSDRLAALALAPAARARILGRTRAIIARNLEVLARWLRERSDRFRWRAPDAGAICHVRYDAPLGSVQLAERLRAEQGVLVVPGDHFGTEWHLRLGFGLPEAELRAALERMGGLFERLRAGPAGGVSRP